MRILYALQGTGNGHVARAMEIVPVLQELADTDVLVSGTEADLNLPFHIKYKFRGISFVSGKQGNVDLLATVKKLRPIRFFKDISGLPVKEYDLIIIDFEPVAAWACKLKKTRSIGLSHQYAVIHPKSPRPNKRDWFGEQVLKHYSPVSKGYGFHFQSFDATSFTPVIRSAIRTAKPFDKKHYTVYLPAYSNEEIEKVLGRFPDIKWEVFSKHCKESYRNNNILFQPVSNEKFVSSFVNCTGILCNAGFETPAEALYMGKKLCVIPMKFQYEQSCNAAFLKELGVAVLPDLKNQNALLSHWLYSSKRTKIKFPDSTRWILGRILLNEKNRLIPN